MKIICRQHLQHEGARADKRNGDAGRSVTSLAIEQLDAARMLLTLSKTVRNSETVAEIGPKLKRASKSGRRTRTRRRGSTVSRPRIGPPKEFVPAVIPQPPPPPGPQPRRTRPQVIIPKSTTRPSEVNEVDGSDGDVAEARTDSMVSARTTRSIRERPSSTARTTPASPITPVAPAEPAVAVSAAASSFEDIREREHYHSLALLHGETIQGYIGPSDRAGLLSEGILVTARRFGSELGENFIGALKARELGLDIEQLEQDADGAETKMVLVVLEGNNLVHRRAIGTVQVRWWTSHRPGFSLMMWVLEGGLPDGISIALGEPYEKRRKYYTRVSSVSGRS